MEDELYGFRLRDRVEYTHPNADLRIKDKKGTVMELCFNATEPYLGVDFGKLKLAITVSYIPYLKLTKRSKAKQTSTLSFMQKLKAKET